MTDRILARKAAAEPRRAANEDLKRSFSSWFWGSIIAATVVHFLAFAAWPTMSVNSRLIRSSRSWNAS